MHPSKLFWLNDDSKTTKSPPPRQSRLSEDGETPQKGHVSEVFLELETFSKQERPTLWAIGIGNIVWWTSFFVVSCNIKKGLHFFPLSSPPFFFLVFFLLQQSNHWGASFCWRFFFGFFPVRTSGWQVGSASGSDLAMFKEPMKRCLGETHKGSDWSERFCQGFWSRFSKLVTSLNFVCFLSHFRA